MAFAQNKASRKEEKPLQIFEFGAHIRHTVHFVENVTFKCAL